MDMCRNQTLNELFKKKGKIREEEARGYLLQLVEGLKYIHEEHVIHRDLKLRNLFLTNEMELKIGDFGLAAKIEEGTKRRTICGTPNYMSPEVLNSQVGHSYETDIWSVGVILYVLIVGRAPFQAPSSKLIYSRIKTGVYVFPKDSNISEPAKDLISKLLNTNPTKRITLPQILEHEFILKSNVSKLVSHCTPNTMLQHRTVTPLLRQSMLSNKEKMIDKTMVGRKTVASPLAVVGNDKIGIQFYDPLQSKVESKIETGVASFETWLKKWIDYSSKYGLGYITTKGCVGVFFNDFSKMILHSDRQYAYKSQIENSIT